MIDLFADIGWLEFQSRYLSVCVGFPYTVVWIVWLELGEHLVSRKGMLPSLSGFSIVNLMWSSILFMWLNRMSIWSFLVMQRLHHLHPFSTRVWRWGIGVPVQLFKEYHVNICYEWRDWWTHSCFIELFVKLVLEGKHTVVQDNLLLCQRQQRISRQPQRKNNQI